MPPVNTPIGKRTPQRTTETLASTELTDRVCVWGGNAGRGVVGMLTCYDLRFPEPSLLLRKQGAQILTYPAAFTMRTGEAHWGTPTLSALLPPIHPLCEHSHFPPAQFFFFFGVQRSFSALGQSKPSVTSSPPPKWVNTIRDPARLLLTHPNHQPRLQPRLQLQPLLPHGRHTARR